MLAAFASLCLAELLAGALRPEASPVTAVGGAVIDRTPAPVKDWAIRNFGSNDKVVLQLGILVLLALFALVLGLVCLRARPLGAAGVLLFGVLGAVAAAGRPAARGSDVWPSVAGALVGALVLWLLSGMLPGGSGRLGPGPSGFGRRRLLLAAGATALVSAGSGLAGRQLTASRRADAAASREAIRLPRPASPARPRPSGSDLRVRGLSSFVTPNRDFYRVDTALVVPRLNADTWRLRLHGKGVARELRFGYADLLERELIERDITLTCVSNQVGGKYAGTARWLGVSLAGLLREAGVRPPAEGGPADQLVARSVDGMTLGTPVDTVMDGRDAMLAVGMNGEVLPFTHGFPVRMLVPGLYGYVSACKWLTELELTTFDDFDAYWVRRDWAREAPIRTQSRIDTPRPFSSPRAGAVAVAGVAWAQHRGIARVEVRVDGGDWQPARLSAEVGKDTWRQWVWEWQADSGDHTLEVRATDGTGATQTSERRGTVPDGATGWHSVVVNVP
ncbi:molybdopterin-dependent oxidoreductase [Streptomyces sp. NA04227]|uniref:molybdopterin-dependent oxidoreductase n=1 Tax=Streptomyces sp. NA04227 TaxID=2742136 RepID=UPI0020CA7C4B|nr:molybdopterin-dependent oxidoreductase [Streptomyces sp. NA04227]